jgi:hypothetical protein
MTTETTVGTHARTTVGHMPDLPEMFCRTKLLNPLKPTAYVMQQQFQHSTFVHAAHTVFMCFVFI